MLYLCLDGGTDILRKDDKNPMFSKLFKPKWQHRNADVRIAALNALSADDPILMQLAGSDEDPAVRRHALRRINDLPELVRFFTDERDEGTKAFVAKRLKRLLAGEEEGSPAVTVRQQLLSELGDEDVLGYVLKHAAELELRRTALATVSRPSLLAEVALSDPSGEMRLEALGRIEREATLERVAKQARGKDKQVARLARERLEAMRIAAERPQRQAAICEAIESLVEQGGVDLIAFGRQQKLWESLAPAADEALARRYAHACDAFAAAQVRIKAEAALSASQRELCDRGEALQQEVERSECDLAEAKSHAAQLRAEWQALAAASQTLSLVLQERFERALAQTEQRLAVLSAERDALARLQRIIDGLEERTGDGNVCSAAVLARIESEWREAGGADTLAQGAVLRTRFQQLMNRAQQQLATQGEESEQLKKVLVELMGQLEAALDEGQLQQASSSYDRIRDRMARLQALGGSMSSSLQKRLHTAVARLREMRDWRRFGTDRAREELLEQAEALAESKLSPQKLAEAVKALRDEWRRLDRKDGPAAEALWQAFDKAAEAAYAPCQAYYDALHQERQANLAVRQRYLDELEQAYSESDWNAPDWSAVEQRLQQAKAGWVKLGGVESRDWREVNGRFRQLIKQFEEKLEPQRQREIQRREGLIVKVERLADEPDLERALSEAKSAQAAWRPVVSALPRIERGLWRRFKTACDAVYARQRAQNQEKRDAEHAERDRLEQLCTELEGLVSGLNGEGLSQSRSRLEDIRQSWSEAQPSVRIPRGLMQRYDAALQAFDRAETDIERRRAEGEQRLLLEKTTLCEAVEARLFGDDGGADADSLGTLWGEKPPLREVAFEQPLAARVERVLNALRTGDQAKAELIASAEENLATARALCLQLELLAGVDSPAEEAEARLAMQVEMLPDAMTGHLAGSGRREAIQRLLAEYLAVGPVSPRERQALTERLGVVLRQKLEA